jgi:hypothetical protein
LPAPNSRAANLGADNDSRRSDEMVFKLAAIIGGVLLMAGVALAGTLTSLDSTNSPTVGTTPAPAATTTVRHDDRGQENELRGRENEPNEDVRGPCDEPEHANDPRCTGVAVAFPRTDDNVAEHRLGHDVADDRGGANSGPGSNSGRSDHSGRGAIDDNSGHGRGGDDGGHSGHGGHGRDD